MQPLIVSAVFDPSNTAPRNSVHEAIITACFSVMDFEPTEDAAGTANHAYMQQDTARQVGRRSESAQD